MAVRVGETTLAAADPIAIGGRAIPVVDTSVGLNAALPAHLAVAIGISIANYGRTMEGTHDRLVGRLESVGHRFGIGSLFPGHDDFLFKENRVNIKS